MNENTISGAVISDKCVSINERNAVNETLMVLRQNEIMES